MPFLKNKITKANNPSQNRPSPKGKTPGKPTAVKRYFAVGKDAPTKLDNKQKEKIKKKEYNKQIKNVVKNYG